MLKKIIKHMDLKDRRVALLEPYAPPDFFRVDDEAALARGELVVPTQRLRLANTPTPIQPLRLPGLPEDFPLFVKRDDFTGGIETTGNKIRKLELLLADAVARRVDAVFTAGGTQSNHARATVAACARLFNLPVHVTLRIDSANTNGNIFEDRMLGAAVSEITKEERQRLIAANPDWVGAIAREWEARTGLTAASIPIGGSNALGTWGYIEMVRELRAQRPAFASEFSHIVHCSGSGGTLAGTAIGVHLAARHDGVAAPPTVLSYCVSDTPEGFEEFVAQAADKILGANPARSKLATVRQAKGEGYAKSTTEELDFVARVARESGIMFDPVYTGKTLFGFWKDVQSGAVAATPGRSILFVHTGGGPSVFANHEELLAAAKRVAPPTSIFDD